MPGDNVAAELIADSERPLEIEPGADIPMPGRGHAKRLGGSIDVEPGLVDRGLIGRSLAAFHTRTDHSQADAVTGDRGAIGNGCAIVAAGNAQAMQLPLRRRRQCNDLADIGDNSGKHQVRS